MNMMNDDAYDVWWWLMMINMINMIKNAEWWWKKKNYAIALDIDEWLWSSCCEGDFWRAKAKKNGDIHTDNNAAYEKRPTNVKTDQRIILFFEKRDMHRLVSEKTKKMLM